MAQTITKLTILGREVAVKKVSAKELEALTKDKQCLGFYDHDSIYISRALSDDRFKRVLLHELAHVVLSVSGAANLLEDDEEEVICDAFESMLELFRNRPVNKFLSE